MKDKNHKRTLNMGPDKIQTTIMIAFSAISLAIMLTMGITMYLRFSTDSRQENIENTQKIMNQAADNMEDYLIGMRAISNAVYYNSIKGNDLFTDSESIQNEMNLLYEANKENLRSIALYNSSGSLLMAEPVAAQKEDPDVTRQEWFQRAVEEVENVHFSIPHIQNLFDDGNLRYYRVLSSSRMVELTNKGDTQTGVLLVDMDYSDISQMMEQINDLNDQQYYYLCDGNGEIIYHPRQVQIGDGIGSESNEKAGRYKDGIYEDSLDGEKRKVIVDTISYAGWKLVGVIPYSSFAENMMNVRYFLVILILLLAMMLVAINRVISVRISSPILKLNESVMEYEAGKKPVIYIGGSEEIRYLGLSIQKSYEKTEALMEKILLEQNERRKSELDALQSQINPHFLYNTLDSITWMIEGERNDEASFMVSQLAKLFRISLSKGHTIISVKDELQHAQSYMNIQKIRYKDRFDIQFDVGEDVLQYSAVKLTLQPILENAINYGVGGMEGDGEIRVSGKLQDGDVILSVSDNGIGMSEEEAEVVLTDSGRARAKGSGVGLVNINSRIQIFFGKEYGVAIKSVPDEGTTVSIRMPAVLYTVENQIILEKGRMPEWDERV